MCVWKLSSETVDWWHNMYCRLHLDTELDDTSLYCRLHLDTELDDTSLYCRLHLYSGLDDTSAL